MAFQSTLHCNDSNIYIFYVFPSAPSLQHKTFCGEDCIRECHVPSQVKWFYAIKSGNSKNTAWNNACPVTTENLHKGEMSCNYQQWLLKQDISPTCVISSYGSCRNSAINSWKTLLKNKSLKKKKERKKIKEKKKIKENWKTVFFDSSPSFDYIYSNFPPLIPQALPTCPCKQL